MSEFVLIGDGNLFVEGLVKDDDTEVNEAQLGNGERVNDGDGWQELIFWRKEV